MDTKQRRAFTLVELLVTVAIIALLAGITAVALRPIRNTAKRTDSANALRQMVLGASAYTADNNGVILPGYVSAERLELLGIDPKLASGRSVDPRLAYGGGGMGGSGEISDASSYVWRLAPYLDDAWKTMYTDYANRGIVDVLTSEMNRASPPGDPPAYGPYTATAGDLGAARMPSFGMNSIFVGGDDVHGGSAITRRNPWEPALAAGESVLAVTRLSEARSPSRLIVFAPSRYPWNEQDDRFAAWPRGRQVLGSPEVRPPFIELDRSGSSPADWTWITRQWHINDGSTSTPEVAKREADNTGEASDFSAGGGLPIVRWGDQIPVGRLDGSVSSFEIERLFIDMRMWSPFETGDYKVDR